jgi:hypothetical protein
MEIRTNERDILQRHQTNVNTGNWIGLRERIQMLDLTGESWFSKGEGIVRWGIVCSLWFGYG